MNDLKYESHKTKPSNADFLPIEIMKILNKPAINFLSTNKIYALSGENFAEGLKSKIIYDKKLSILKFLCSLKLLDRTIDKLDKDKLKTRFSELRRILLSITQPMYDKSGAFPELENIETNIPKRRRDLIQKSLKFLVSHNILQKNDDVYKLNFLHWFKQQRYRLSTNNFLDDLIPLLASFIKYNSSNKVDVFLNHIDNIIGRILKAPKNQSAYANMENYIIEIINRDYYREELYTISYFTSDVSNNISKKSFEKLNTYKEVVLKQLFFNDDGKKILKITTSTDLDVDIFIERVYKLNAKSTDINAVSTKDGKSFVVYNDIYAQIINNTNYINLFSQAMKTNNKKNNQAITEQYRMNQSFYDAVLEVDTNLSESFDVKLLNKQKTYQTLNEKIDFLDNGLDDFFTNVDDEDKNNIKNGIKRSLESSISTNSKFYVTTLKEERDQLLDTLYSHKDNISILYPMELKKDYFEELKLAQEQIKL